MKKLILTLTTLLSASAIFSQGPGCPSIDVISYQGTNVSPITLPCDSTCVTLKANVFQIAQTSSYTVSSLPYNGLPYSASSGVSLNIDDRWSGIINLPFKFCFFGNVFDRAVVSSNGAISFNTQYANSYHQWSFGVGEQIPTNTAAFRPNTIFGAMHDTDPSKGGTIRYGVQGSFPCRVFVMSFENLRHYDCNSKRTTQQIVIYEGTNIIEVYIQNKPSGCAWNSGLAAIGIQNAAGDVGYAPPGRNTGNWSATNEAWRFSPSGAPSYQITWHETNVTNPPVGTGATFVACPTNSFSTYSALLTYTNCANETNQFWQSIDINLGAPGLPVFTSNSPVCETQTLNFDGPTIPGATYAWTGPNGWTSNVENPSIPGATNAISGTYSLQVTVAGCPSAVYSEQVTVVSAATTPIFNTNSPICEGDSIRLVGNNYANATYVWGGPSGFSSTSQSPVLPATAASAGNYSLYIVVNGCTSGTANHAVVVSPAPALVPFTTNSPICVGNDIIFNAPNIPGATYNWTGPGGWTSSIEDPTRPNASVGAAGDYHLSITVNGCSSPLSMQSVVINGPDVPVFSNTSPVCTGEDVIFSTLPVAGATYVWNGPNGWNPGSVTDATLSNTNASMTGNYSLYIVTSGCTSETTIVPVFITPQLAPSFTVNSPLCVGDTILFNAPADSTVSYHWSGPNSWVDSSGASPIILGATTAMSGTYNLYTITLGCTSAVGTQSITVNPIPAAPTISSNSPVCEGSSINLNGPTISGATYAWSGPNNYSSGAEDNILNPSSSNMAGTYQLTVQVAGCQSPVSSLNVVVNDTAQVVPNITPTVPCQGSLVNFDATVTIQAPSVVLGSGWDVDGNGVPDYLTTQATHVYNAAGTYNTTYAVITTGNCTTSVSVPVTVSPKPTVSYTGPTENCGTNLSLTSTGQVQAPAIINNYEWYLTGGSSIGNGQNLTHTFNANPFQQVTGYVVSSTANGCSDTATFTINLQPTPVSSFSVNPCIGLTVPFTNTSTWQGTPGPGTTVSNSWTFGDGQSSVLQNPTNVYQNTGTYQVTLISTSSGFNCSDTIKVDVPVSIVPEVKIVTTPECFQNVTFLGQINSFGSDVVSLVWDLGNGGSSSDTSFIYEYLQAGTYNVTLTVTNEENCSTTVISPVTVLPSPTLDEIDIPNVITPNGDGTNDEIKLDTQFETCTDYEMVIFNRWGNLIYRQVMGGVPFKGLSAGGKKLSNGVYFYTIKAGKLNRNGTITIAY
jgi:gliding motility-associated-like protein